MGSSQFDSGGGDGGGGGGGDNSVISSDGYIDWQRLGVVLIGVIAYPVFEGVANLISAVFSLFAIQPAESTRDRLVGGIEGLLETFTVAMNVAWREVNPAEWGLLGFVFALVFVLAAAYAWATLGDS